MRVLVAMSGGVDSSVAAAMLLQEGHDVVGATLKLWGGSQDSGCCSVGDVEDARRVAQQLGITHHVFNFTDVFTEAVVNAYTADHASGRTPNPCVECNRHVKFDRLVRRAHQLGFDAVATGHHAKIVNEDGWFRLCRGTDRAKDQSYVLHMLGQSQLAQLLFPVGQLTKAGVREFAARLGLRTAHKAESQDTCFITASAGRVEFLRERIPLHAGVLVDAVTGERVGNVAAVESITVGQRRGLGLGGGDRRYAVSVDVNTGTVLVDRAEGLLTDRIETSGWSWTGRPPAEGAVVAVQTSAHGRPQLARLDGSTVHWRTPQRRVAPGQSVVLYDAGTTDEVLGGALAS